MRDGKYIIYIDMDDTLCDFSGAHKKCIERVPQIKYPQCQMDFFRKLKPLDGAVEVFKWLQDHPKFDPWILTAPSTYNPLCYTEKRLWVEDHLGMEAVEQMIISPDKSLLKGDFLIDDRTNAAGQDRFEGRLLIFGSVYSNWKSIKKYFVELSDQLKSL